MGELLPGNHWRETQFWVVNGAFRGGLCGDNAVAAAESWSNQSYVWTGTIYQRLAAAKRLSDANGATTIWQQRDQLAADGFQTVLRGFADPWPDWANWYHAQINAGRCIVMETANGQALVNYLGNITENAANLKYHSILILGYHPGGQSGYAGRVLPAGWWAADGDNRATGNVLQFYPDAVMAAARPVAAVAVYPRAAAAKGQPAPTPAPQPQPVPPAPAQGGNSLPAGWADSNGQLTGPAAPDGQRYFLRGGMRDHALSMLADGVMSADDMALELEHADGPDRIVQTTNYHRLIFARKDASSPYVFFLQNLGASVLANEGKIGALSGQLSQAQAQSQQLQQQLQATNTQLGQLQAELKAAQSAGSDVLKQHAAQLVSALDALRADIG